MNTYNALNVDVNYLFEIADIRQVIAYIDTVEMFFNRYLPHGIRTKLEEIHGKRIQIKPCQRGKSIYGFRLIINQPSKESLKELDHWQRRHGQATFYRCDLAIDFITASTTKAEQIHAYLIKYILLKWRRRGAMQDCGENLETVYWIRQKGRRRSNRDLVAYADKLSKVMGEPCAHLELRLQRSPACRREKLRKAGDIITLNPKHIFNKHLGLSDIVDRYLVKMMREAVKDDIKLHQGRREKSDFLDNFMDKYRASKAKRVKSILSRSGQDRAQLVKDDHKYMKVKLEDLDKLGLPDHLTFGFVENIEEFEKDPHECDVVTAEG